MAKIAVAPLVGARIEIEKVNKSGTFKRLRVLVIDSNKSKKYINIYNRSKEGHEEKEEGCVYRL